MTDRDSRTRSRARTPGVVVKPLHGGARSGPRPGSERATDVTTKCKKDGCKPGVTTRMSGADLSEVMFGKAPSESQPSSRTEGKPAVRNERGDRGNVGIMRSPLRASILPARSPRLGTGQAVWWNKITTPSRRGNHGPLPHIP